MKIIDLINKIKNNEEVPIKIKLDNTIFEYDKDEKEYIHKLSWCSETLLFKAMEESTYSISNLLEAEVEVIEENKEIRELPHGTYLELKNGSTIGSRTKDHYNIENILNGIRIDLKIHQDKINELVQAVNKINKESDK